MYLAPLGIENAVVAVAVTAGAAFFAFKELFAPVTIAQMRCFFTGSPTGNVDMGIYDATGTNGGPGNLLGHTGAIAASAGVYTKNLTANLSLSQGQYWLAFLDTVADSPDARSANIGLMPVVRSTATNLTVLPATAGAFASNGILIQMNALILNGFS